ncbi:MAG: ABC transporter ATP-binding protein [Brevinema sp.]
MSFISFENIEKYYGDYHALKNISLQIEQGKFIVLLGPSGSGKSTLLRILAGLEDISSGKVILDGDDITGIDPAERDVAMVFQNYALYPHMTVRKNLSYGLENRKIPKEEIESRIKSVAEILEIDHLLDRKPAELSGGQRQRVAMGRAIVRKPKVFLFDEPLSNLDAQLRVKMRLEIKNLQQRLGITTIFVTHDQVEALTMADQIVLMNHAEIVQVGSATEIYQSPDSIFAAKFIGTPSMGMLPLTLEGDILMDIFQKFSFRITHNQAQLIGKKLLLGLRAEHFSTESIPSYQSLQLCIQNIENLGSYFSLQGICDLNKKNNSIVVHDSIYVNINNNQAHQFSINNTYTFYWNPEVVKLFDVNTGQSLGFLSEFIN